MIVIPLGLHRIFIAPLNFVAQPGRKLQCFHRLHAIWLVRCIGIPESCRTISQSSNLPQNWLKRCVGTSALRSQVRQIVGLSKGNLAKCQETLKCLLSSLLAVEVGTGRFHLDQGLRADSVPRRLIQPLRSFFMQQFAGRHKAASLRAQSWPAAMPPLAPPARQNLQRAVELHRRACADPKNARKWFCRGKDSRARLRAKQRRSRDRCLGPILPVPPTRKGKSEQADRNQSAGA